MPQNSQNAPALTHTLARTSQKQLHIAAPAAAQLVRPNLETKDLFWEVKTMLAQNGK
jgi:hypothetical protein